MLALDDYEVVYRRQKGVKTALYCFTKPNHATRSRLRKSEQLLSQRSCDYLYQMLRPWILCRKRAKPVVHRTSHRLRSGTKMSKTVAVIKPLTVGWVDFAWKKIHLGSVRGAWHTNYSFVLKLKDKNERYALLWRKELFLLTDIVATYVLFGIEMMYVVIYSRSINASFLFRYYIVCFFFLSFFLSFFL